MDENKIQEDNNVRFKSVEECVIFFKRLPINHPLKFSCNRYIGERYFNNTSPNLRFKKMNEIT